MDLSWWISESLSRTKSNGLEGLRWSGQTLYKKSLQTLFKIQSCGEEIYERDWDVLIILDACRLDLMRETAPDFGFSECGSIVSMDTTTKEWMKANFTDEYHTEMRNTVYICGNPYSEKVLSGAQFSELDEVWRYAWDEEIGTLPPNPVTDRAIAAGRERDNEKLIIHYMQPHYPFIYDKNGELRNSGDAINIDQLDSNNSESVWDRLQQGKITQEATWEEYEANLHGVLESVQILLDNLDSDHVVITSDHGNALGEWNIYGHPMHMPLKELRRVPWIRTEATDTGGYMPDTYKTSLEEKTDTKQRLADLGYLEE